MKTIYIPSARLASNDDELARKKRREIRMKLLRGEEVKVTPQGMIIDPEKNPDTKGITVPAGKLAVRKPFFWYERDHDLLRDEKAAMKRFFPDFKLDQIEDGRLCWYGRILTDLRPGGSWNLMAIYDNNHPHADTYGGSVKVYSIEPDLEEISEELDGCIPHTLRDSAGQIYLCTADPIYVQASNTRVTSAASSLSWAVKWISAFELWISGDLSTNEFKGHDI